MNFKDLLDKYKLQIAIGLTGVILLGLGVFLFSAQSQKSPEIEILTSEFSEPATIFVDLEGAVEKPGVYELPLDSRINDLLVRSGGLSAEADRDWVEKNLNLAQKLADGVKIYIPQKGESGQIAGGAAENLPGGAINLNTATAAQLNSLWGIGEKRAGDIIANRPYQTTEELVSRKIIPQNIYERIKSQITVF